MEIAHVSAVPIAKGTYLPSALIASNTAKNSLSVLGTLKPSSLKISLLYIKP